MKNNTEDIENISPSLSKIDSEEVPKENEHQRIKMDDLNLEPESLTTKIYYFVDDQNTPYSTEVPIPPSKITLNDFKRYVTRRSYKYYCKVMDTALNAEVKAEIRDEYEVLKPNSNGRFELFLLSENSPQTFLSNLPAMTAHTHQFQPTKNRAVRASVMAKRTSTHYIAEAAELQQPFIDNGAFFSAGSSPEENRLFADSNFASSLSDGESQYTTTDFTSVSQQNHHQFGRYGFGAAGNHGHGNALGTSNRRYDSNNKPYWTREKRKRYRRTPPPSFLSSTFEDTEVSMALDLITVTFNMDTRRPFGMSVVVKKNRAFYGIVVHEVAPNSLVALDGRIKPGYILLEINGIPLDEYDTPEEAVNVLSNAVRQAVENRGQIKITCARGDIPRPVHSIFRPPKAEPVRPIDPTAWVEHTNAARGITEGFQYQNNNNFMADMPKSATIPKAGMAIQMGKANGQTGAGPFKPNLRNCGTLTSEISNGMRMLRNPQVEITRNSENSSLECSIGQQGKGMGSKGRGIGAALRRLVCIPTTGKRGTSRKRKNSKGADKK